MDHGSLATKHRPQHFGEIVGQNTTVSAVLGMFEKKGGLNRTILLSGPHGTGKTTVARLISLYANCEGGLRKDTKTGLLVPCETCQSCKEFRSGTHPDTFEINAASNRGIDEIRSIGRLARNMPKHNYVVFVLDECQSLTSQAFEASLKILEEPPQYTIFVLCTTAPQKLPGTIRSRAFPLTLDKVDDADIAKLLRRVCKREKLDDLVADTKAIEQIAKTADGHPRDALMILERVINIIRSDGGDGKIPIQNLLPKILDDSVDMSPDLMAQQYISAVLQMRVDAAIRIARNVYDVSAFLPMVMEVLENLILKCIGSDVADPRFHKVFTKLVDSREGGIRGPKGKDDRQILVYPGTLNEFYGYLIDAYDKSMSTYHKGAHIINHCTFRGLLLVEDATNETNENESD